MAQSDGQGDWPSATATVFSSEWVSKPLHEDGHRHITYNYSVESAWYSGEFFDSGLERDDYLKLGQTFEVKFDPSNPSRSYYPDLRTKRTLVWAAAGVALAVLVIGLALLAKFTSR